MSPIRSYIMCPSGMDQSAQQTTATATSSPSQTLLPENDVPQCFTNLDVGRVVLRKPEADVPVQKAQLQALVDAVEVHQRQKANVHHPLPITRLDLIGHGIEEGDLVRLRWFRRRRPSPIRDEFNVEVDVRVIEVGVNQVSLVLQRFSAIAQAVALLGGIDVALEDKMNDNMLDGGTVFV